MIKNINKFLLTLVTIILICFVSYLYLSKYQKVSTPPPPTHTHNEAQQNKSNLNPFFQTFSYSKNHVIQYIAKNKALSKLPGPIDKRLFCNYHVKNKNKTPNLKPVSIVEIAENEYLFCNNTNIFHITKNNSTITDIPYTNYNGIWVPTGLWWHNETLYLANYLGNNILVFKFDKKNMNLHLIKEIRHELLISPENIYANDTYIATANYNGNSVTVFNHQGNLMWHEVIGAAHGIVGDDTYLYVTGLKDQMLYKFDYTGKLHAKAGGLGFSIGKYAWPVGISILNDGRLIITDAHNGRISFLNKEFKVIGAIGTNGSGANMLHFPYAVIPQNDTLLCIVDTFNSRFLFLNSEYQIQKTIQINQDTLAILPGSNPDLILEPLMPEDPYTYCNKLNCLKKLFQPLMNEHDEIYSGYNVFRILNANKKVKTFIKADFLINMFYTTFATLTKVGDMEILVIFSPQGLNFLAIDPKTLAFTPCPTHQNIWDVNSDILKQDLLAFNIPAKFKKVRTTLNSKKDPVKTWNQIFKKIDYFNKDLISLIGKTEEGKHFKQGLIEGKPLKNLYNKYISEISQAQTIYLCEYLAITFISKNTIDKKIYQ